MGRTEDSQRQRIIDAIGPALRSARQSLAYAAPEAQGLHWERLGESLLDAITQLQEEDCDA